MILKTTSIDYGDVVRVAEPAAPPKVIVVCEHASNRVPAGLAGLGLGAKALDSHIAWDPGALGVAERLASRLSAVLVAGEVSRLVYDCNRPPEAASAIPARSEIYDIPGNADLGREARAERAEAVYFPFARSLQDQIARHRATLEIMVTIHSFTPVFQGQPRAVELGVLHGSDDRLARAMMQTVPAASDYDTRMNAPYSAVDGVAHTLDVAGAANGLENVMLEIRNDLIQTPEQQEAMAAHLANWLRATWEGLS